MKTTSYKTGLLQFAGALCICVGAFVVSTSPVMAQSNADMASRLGQLENQIQTLSRAVYRGEKPPAGAVPGLVGANSEVATTAISNFEVRLSQIESQQREMTGRIEELMHQVQQLQTQMDKMAADNELRFQQLQGGGSSAVSTTTSSGGSVTTYNPNDYSPDNYSISNTGSDQTLGTSGGDAATSLYEAGFADIRAAQYESAERKFKEFMSSYSNHGLAGNAQYWLAETYYVRGDYREAAKMFAQGYQEYPQGNKAADSLLKLGLSLSKLGKKEDACLSFQQLKKQFPGERSAIIGRANQEIKDIGCAE